MKHVSYVAILAGALLYAGAANAQFVNDGTYIDNPTGTGTGAANPVAIPTTPGTGALATNGAWVLEGLNNTTPISTSVANAVGPNGTPTVTYHSEAAAATAYVATTAQATALTTAGTGGTWAAGDYLVYAPGTANAGKLYAGPPPSAALAKQLVWVSPTAVDPTVHWQQATYNQETAAATAVTHTNIAAIPATSYLIDSTGKLVSTSAATAAGLTATSSVAQIAAAGFTVVPQGSADPKATAASVASTDYAYTGVAGVSLKNGANTVTGTLGGGVLTNTTTGQALAVGPGGAVISDPNGGGAGSPTSTTVAAGKAVLTGPGASGPGTGFITLDATTDPTLTVSNGTPAGTTIIHNGDVTVGNSLKVGVGAANSTLTGAGLLVQDGAGNAAVVAPTAVGVGNANGAAGAVVQGSGKPALAVYGPTGATQFSASSDGTISAGGNQIHDVAAPTAGTDAVNKAFMDTGLSNLNTTLTNKIGASTAAAMSLASPDRVGNQTGAIAFSEAWWGGHTATGITVVQRIADFGSYDISVGGGVAIADTGDIGGRGTVQIGWGGGYAPLK